MNVIVTKKDESVIYGGKIYKCGEAFEVDDVIAKSLIERGYVKATEMPAPMDETEAQEAAVEADNLDEMSYPDLKSVAAQMGLDAKGKKDELIERIRNAAAASPEEADELPNTNMPE